MNTITIVDDTVVASTLDQSVSLSLKPKNELFDVDTFHLTIEQDTNLTISYHNQSMMKQNIVITVKDHVCCWLFEQRTGHTSKVQYQYHLGEQSKIEVQQVYDCIGMRQLDMINLNGYASDISLIRKSICKQPEKYDVMVYHEANHSKSDIIMHGVSILEGQLIIDVTSVVVNGIKHCVANQTSEILNVNGTASIIKPNLLIEEQEVEANHVAFIGVFDEESLFYLQSRGIPMLTAQQLLVKHFLLKGLTLQEDVKEQLIQTINQYWG